MRKLLGLTSTALMTVGLFMAPAANANPNPDVPPPDFITVPLLPLTPDSPPPASSDCPTQKCDCKLHVDYPHKSNTPPRVPNVHSRVSCKQPQPRIRATADLYERGSWSETKVAPRGEMTTHGKDYAKANAARSSCMNADYHGVGSGYVDHLDGTKLGNTADTYGTVSSC